MSVEDRVRWLADWCDDLKDEELSAIRTACHRWREGSDRRFPMLGQLKPLIAAATRSKPANAESYKPWRPLSHDEYAELSLREKIRHQKILASEAGNKAGPQCLNKRPAKAEDMPEAWHIWKRQQREHADEVMKLSKTLRDLEARDKSAPTERWGT